MQIEALIPLASSSDKGALVAVVARKCPAEESIPHPAGLDRRISALNDMGLYRVGLQALAVVENLRLQKRQAVLSDCQVAVLNPGDIAGLTPENTRSAELGVALTLLMFAARGGSTRVIASGALVAANGNSDIAVEAVYHIGKKLQQIVASTRRPGQAKRPEKLLLPVHDPDGIEVKSRYAGEIANLEAMGIKVCCVATLLDACCVLGITEFRVAERLIRRRRAARALLAVLGIAVGAYMLANQPVALNWQSRALANNNVSAEPLRIAAGQKNSLLHPSCMNPIDSAKFAVGDKIAISMRAEYQPWQRSLLQYFLVGVSDVDGIKVLSLHPDVRRKREAVFNFQVPLEKANGPNVLIMIVTNRLSLKGETYFESQLQQRLLHAQGHNISAAVNWLKENSLGQLVYYFDVAKLGDGFCSEA